GRHGEPIDMRGVIDIALCAARTDADGAGSSIDPHAFHHRHVDHQSTVDATKAWPVVPASADRDLEIVLPCKIHRGDNVSSVGASRNQYGTLVDHPVEETPNSIIVGIPLPDDGTTHVADEGFGGHGFAYVLLFPHMIGQLVRSLPAIGSTGLVMVGIELQQSRAMLWITRYSTPQIPCPLVSNRVHEMVLAHFNQARADIAAVKGVDEYPHDRTSAVWPCV